MNCWRCSGRLLPMSPNAKANIAFGIGMLAGFYALGGMAGLTILIVTALVFGRSVQTFWIAPLLGILIGTPVAFFAFRFRRRLRRFRSYVAPEIVEQALSENQETSN